MDIQMDFYRFCERVNFYFKSRAVGGTGIGIDMSQVRELLSKSMIRFMERFSACTCFEWPGRHFETKKMATALALAAAHHFSNSDSQSLTAVQRVYHSITESTLSASVASMSI